MGPLTSMFLAASLGLAQDQKTAAQALAEPLAAAVVQAGYGRVGVVPRFIQREGDMETLSGSTGPQGAWLAEDLSEGLIAASAGRFKVVGQDRMARAFKDAKLAIEDLGSPDALRKVADQVGGLDALIVGRTRDEREAPGPDAVVGRVKNVSVNCKLIDVRSGDVGGVAKREIPATPALRVYRGESEEVNGRALESARTAGDAKGRNVPDEAPEPPTERTTNAAPGPDDLHPFERKDFPLPLHLTVDGKEREFIPVRDPRTGRRVLYAPVEPGESYAVITKNDLATVVYMCVFVDGINVLGKKRDLDDPKYWNIAPGKKGMVDGYYTQEMKGGKAVYRVEKFAVGAADDSVAAGQNFRDEIGQIAVVYYLPEGQAPEPKKDEAPKPGDKSIEIGTYGTVAGKAEDAALNEVAGARRGKFLAGFTIRYAPKSQIEKLPILSR